jgi:sec-independent protein translocase protein TatC
VFLVAGAVNPSPDPWSMLILGGVTVVLVEIAEVFVYFNDRRRLRLHPPLYEHLSDDEISPIDAAEPVEADSSVD